MRDDPPRGPESLRARREGVIEALTTHFANDRIDAEEFESRVDRAWRAGSLRELEEVYSDLPAISQTASAPSETLVPLPALAPVEEVRRSQAVLALLGGTERKGSWVPAQRVTVVAMMGGVDLDFREARFARGITEVTVFALMGGVDILVPPGLRVESEGLGILGGFEGLDQAGVSDDPGQPVLRIRGVAVMGGVDVSERRPGESARDRKRRLREERRNRRLKPGGE